MAPPWLLAQILIGIAKFLPKQKLVPQKDLAEMAFKELDKREMVCFSPFFCNRLFGRSWVRKRTIESCCYFPLSNWLSFVQLISIISLTNSGVIVVEMFLFSECRQRIM